jgi:hypothetical protein
MDALSTAGRWPKHPYRGLDFYGESEARLFRGRDAEIRECAAILLRFGVKILLLQGSSGSGKSSFLRAGLIPYLRQSEPRNFLLNGKDSVIRCTSDPLPEIARSLVDTFGSSESWPESVQSETGWGGEARVEEAVCSEVRRSVTEAISGPRDQLANALVSALLVICGELPGKLILVLDQAEEVLTLEPSGGAGAAFFRFLEEIYLRNIDARLVVALRTEYYGRFRDELRISDDRLSNRPASGGVEPFLLRPLREKNALSRIVEAPTLATAEDGASVYKFEFEAGLVERIIDDLLETFPHASVTPALQVVCSTLYGEPTGRDRTITYADYTRLGGNIGIFGEYLERGITAAGPRSKVQLNQWRELLHSLVSRQGGGTLVSLIEPLEELERKARDLGIGGAIGPVLGKLTGGSAPLLRGEPPENPRNFSLKHDVLAVMLARWYAEHAETVKAKKEAKRWWLAGGLGALVVGLCLGSMVWQRAEEAFQAKVRAISLTNKHAIHAPDGNFRLSLLLTLANLDATERPGDFHEWVTGGDKQIHAETLAEFRKALSRAPWFAGRYRADGLDGSSDRIALLFQDQRALQILTLPPEGGEAAEPELKTYELPAQTTQVSMLPPAAGFVGSLGPAALVNGRVYFWNERGEIQDCGLGSSLPPSITSGSWIRAEFVGGRLQISTAERHELKLSLRLIRLDASDLRACSGGAVLAAEVLQLPERPFSQQLVPVFSEAPDMPQSFEYLEETSEPVPNDLGANLPIDPSRTDPERLVELDALVGLPEREGGVARIAVGQVSPDRGIPGRLHYSIAPRGQCTGHDVQVRWTRFLCL